MNEIITAANIDSFAYSNRHLITENPPRGICVDFFGLNTTEMLRSDPENAKIYAQYGILYIFPYNNPWNWMNPQAVKYTDRTVTVLREMTGMKKDAPIVACGGSMGGHSALVYCAYSEHHPIACVSNCPVCDLPYHYTERPDLPRTLYSAYCHEEGDVMEVLARYSPYHLAVNGKMPHIAYTDFHCTADMAVNKEKHSDRFVCAMKENGYDVRYITVEGRGHCDLTAEAWEEYRKTVIRAVTGETK